MTAGIYAARRAMTSGRLGSMLDFPRRLAGNAQGMVGLVMLLAAVLCAVFASQIAGADPSEMAATRLLPPSAEHWMGTDYLGRDVWSRIVHGTRSSLAFAFGAAALSFCLGTFLGAVAGYSGGVVDNVLNRVFELFLVVPMLFLVILLSALFGTSTMIAAIVVGATIWPSNARIARAQVLTLKSRLFVKAARCAGAGSFRILFRHILPNGIQPLIVNSTLQVGAAVLFQASLSFLGLTDADTPSWGMMLREAQPFLSAQWTGALFPGLAIAWLIVSISLVGEAVNRVLNGGGHERA